MFNQLLRVSNSEKTRLEDFTTELLVGLMRKEPKVTKRLCDLLTGFNAEDYQVRSQVAYPLNGKKCIIDIEIKTKDAICFVENKVNACEGSDQLNRYAQVLDGISEKFKHENGFELKTRLVYCTKKFEKKTLPCHDFKQIYWHNIASAVKAYTPNILIELFLEFLKINEMDYNLKLSSESVASLEHFFELYVLISKLMDTARIPFESKFGISKSGSDKNKIHLRQSIVHNRMAEWTNNVMVGDDWSEILYSFDARGDILAQIFVSNGHLQHSAFASQAILEENRGSGLKQQIYDVGTSLYIKKQLSEFAGKEDAEIQINEWFVTAFDKLSEFIKRTQSEIAWSDEVKRLNTGY